MTLRPSSAASYLPDAMIVRIADIDRAVGTDDRAVRAVEAGRASAAAVAAGALTTAGKVSDDARRAVDAADRVVFGIDDEEAAVAVDRHFLWRVEDRRERRAAIAAMAAGGGAGDRRDDPARRIDCAQAAALALEDVDRAVRPNLDGAGAENAGFVG